jgi:alkylation response protein AidB-like acyl-CoA dehydrogenase
MWRLTDEERKLREHIRSVVLEQIRPRVREMDENCDYPHDVHETLAREGLMGLALPFEFGGREATEVSWCAYVEELAKISGTVSLMAAYVKLVSLPILLAGTDEQKREYLPPLVSGER